MRARRARKSGSARGLAVVAVLTLAMSAVVLTTPPPAEAQTERTEELWSATLTVDAHGALYGCNNSDANLANCSAALTSDRFAAGRYQITRVTLNSASKTLILRVNPTFHGGVNRWQVPSLTVVGRDLGQGLVYGAAGFRWTNVTNLTWTDGQEVRLSLRLHIPPVSHRYGWCFNRSDMNASDCIGAIDRWDQLSAQRNPITVSLDNDGRTEKRCPSTHQIRKATTSGIKCERTYAPVLPAAGALAEAWGVTQIAPPSALRDGWDGATRSCQPQSRGYVVLETARWHGLNQGCHSHSAIGGAHHEHSRQNH